MSKPNGLIVLNEADGRMIYGPDELRGIARHVHLMAPMMSRASLDARPDLLKRADVLFSGWGGPRLDQRFLNAAPQLKAVFYGSGSLASIVTEAAWNRGVLVTTAIHANAVPVAEYALATILFSLKHGWRLSYETRHGRGFPDRNAVPGCYGTTVGLISFGAVARKLLELLRPFDLQILVYDPFLTVSDAAALGVESVTLDELFARSTVVSLHTPHLPETVGMITGRHLASIVTGGAFINTARAQVVRQDELIEVARRRPDLQFVLDVTSPEPPEPTSPLYTLPNVLLTPHMAGSVGNECRRMGRYMVEELERYVAGRPLKWLVTAESIWHSSHRPHSMQARPSAIVAAAAVTPSSTAAQAAALLSNASQHVVPVRIVIS